MYLQTFVEWLVFQSHRPDAVGWLAMNWIHSPDAPQASSVADVATYMRAQGAAAAAMEALEVAAQEYLEYRAQVPTNVVAFPMARA